MKKGKMRNILKWIPQVLMGVQFVLAGQTKFTKVGGEVWAREFEEWGFPAKFYLMIGALELIGGLLLFIPKFASKAALGVGVIMIGATLTHAIYAEWQRMVVTFVFVCLLGLVYYLRRNGPVKNLK